MSCSALDLGVTFSKEKHTSGTLFTCPHKDSCQRGLSKICHLENGTCHCTCFTVKQSSIVNAIQLIYIYSSCRWRCHIRLYNRKCKWEKMSWEIVQIWCKIVHWYMLCSAAMKHQNNKWFLLQKSKVRHNMLKKYSHLGGHLVWTYCYHKHFLQQFNLFNP